MNICLSWTLFPITKSVLVIREWEELICPWSKSESMYCGSLARSIIYGQSTSTTVLFMDDACVMVFVVFFIASSPGGQHTCLYQPTSYFQIIVFMIWSLRRHCNSYLDNNCSLFEYALSEKYCTEKCLFCCPAPQMLPTLLVNYGLFWEAAIMFLCWEPEHESIGP